MVSSKCNLDGKDRKQLVDLACYAERAERYDDMAAAMHRVVDIQKQAKEKLGIDERNLLSVAYKNVIGTRRTSWRVISNIEAKSESSDRKKGLVNAYKLRIEAELNQICDEVLEMLIDHLIPSTTDDDADSMTFYLKMKGDYYRYKAETVASTEDKHGIIKQARDAYEEAFSIATDKMGSTDPTRLGLALNFSVFYYEILNTPDQACHLAKKAFDEAIAELETSGTRDDALYRDSTMILQLIRDNLTLWTSDQEAKDNE